MTQFPRATGAQIELIVQLTLTRPVQAEAVAEPTKPALTPAQRARIEATLAQLFKLYDEVRAPLRASAAA